MLYQNSLVMYIPHTYDMFLYQHGGAYYSEDGLTTTLDNPICYQAFKSMVELYTKYAVPCTTNFYNRFRTGELPIGIGTFSDYMSLTVGAGNLSGKWGIAPVPGVKREDGSISHATSGSVTSSAVMMTACEEQEAGWAFLKWWLSAQTQAAFAQEVETRIGTGSRVATANNVAFQQPSWPAEHLEVLLGTRENAIENPGVLGGYYVARYITNAWNAVITDADQAIIRDEFEHAIEMIQIEMDNKQAEYMMSFLMAWLLNGMKGRKFFALCLYAPSIASGVAMAQVWLYLFSNDAHGFLNNLFLRWGFISTPILWNQNADTIFAVVIIISIWMSMGSGFLVFMAGLQNLPGEVMEQGRVDGIKNRVQELVYLILPMMKPQLLFDAINSIVGSFGVFDVVVQFAGMPSPNYSAHTIVAHLYDYAFNRFQMGYASAVAVVLFTITFVLGRVVMWALKSDDE